MRAVLNRVLRVCKLRGLKTEWQLFVRVVAHRRVKEVSVVASLLQGPAEVRKEVLFEGMLGYEGGREDGKQTESGLLIIIDSRLRWCAPGIPLPAAMARFCSWMTVAI